MRLLIVGGFGPGQLPDSYVKAFERLGVEVIRFDSDRAYFEAGRWSRFRPIRRALRSIYWARVNRTLVEFADRVQPQMVLAIKASFMDAETVLELRRRLGAVVVNYYPDNPYCGVPWNPRKTSAQRRDLLSVLRQYDRVWIWEPSLAQRLSRDGVVAAYLPFAFDDEIFKPFPGVSPPCEECGSAHTVVFIGQHSDKRAAHVDAIRKHRVALWGNRWQRESQRFETRHLIHSKVAFGADCARIYSGAAVVLNIVDDLNMPGHNMRTFEIPGSGGVMLASFTREQAALFPEGVAAAYYRRPSEIDSILSGLLEDPSALERMRREAVSIASAQTYRERARTILSETTLKT